MRRRSKTSGEPAKTRRRKTVTLKRGNAPRAVRRRSPSIADLQDELDRRTRERDEALAKQAATSDILRVIRQSRTDVRPTFDRIVKTAVQLLHCDFAIIFTCNATSYSPVVGATPEGAITDLGPTNLPIDPIANFPSRAIAERKMFHVPDWLLFELPEHERRIGAMLGVNSALYLPLLSEGECVGLLALAGKSPNAFGAAEIAQSEDFRDQALIAIENARLFNETKEALAQQTATSEVLRVISSSAGDLEPVFATMLQNATRICEADFGNIYRREGDAFRLVTSHNAPPAFIKALERLPYISGKRMLATKSPVHVADARTLESYLKNRDPVVVAAIELGSVRTFLAVPMLKDDDLIGALMLNRKAVHSFTDQQIALVQSFANQAVIAIENAGLLSELRESLQQQTATADVLKVISRSTFDLQAVLDTLVASAGRLCEADMASINREIGDAYQQIANYGHSPELQAYMDSHPIPVGRGSVAGRVVMDGRIIHIHDVLSEPDYKMTEAAKLGGIRTMLGVPLLREGTPIGVIALQRKAVRPFTQKQIELVTTFADQAVIAIENVRLFEAEQQRTLELTESLEQQTATSEVLQVISSSPGDLEPVFSTMLANAVRICDAKFGDIYRWQNDALRLIASHNTPPAFTEDRRRNSPYRSSPTAPVGRMLATRAVIHVVDLAADEAYLEQRSPGVVAAVELGGVRTLLIVPMLKESELIGGFILSRQEVRPFAQKQIELVQNFAAQAVIAVENTRLLNELRQRTADLTQSLQDLRTAQDRLVQTEKLASLGQLTAGIAHEIKNPLNFVNNFSAVSVELIDELREALGSAHLDSKLRAEIGEIADTLQGNLDKVVQHGKRADAIVKNMLLHSRQGSGEHRQVDINALVDESLNLAYHGARAEKQAFNITLERSFDPTAGEVDLFPQEITRVLLNLISNGFYAVTKRKAEANGGDYEPTLAAATKSLGRSVEIRIRDNGTGIPPEAREKLFNPFFTTKPAGEGTGLGLSISHDIIVKQHGGSIEVDTRPGEFTEFRIVLPRAAASAGKPGGGA